MAHRVQSPESSPEISPESSPEPTAKGRDDIASRQDDMTHRQDDRKRRQNDREIDIELLLTPIPRHNGFHSKRKLP